MEKKIFIEGMTCANCAKHVKDALMEIEGVTSVPEVNIEGSFALAIGNFEDDKVREALKEAGYKVSRIKDVELKG